MSVISPAPATRSIGPPPRRVRWRMFPANLRVFFWRLTFFPLVILGLTLLMAGPFRIWLSLGGPEYDGEVTDIHHLKGRRGGVTVHMTYSYSAGGKVHFGNRQIQESQ